MLNRSALPSIAMFALMSPLVPSGIAGDHVDGRFPNIVVIMADDMGYGDPGCYNAQSKIPTPNINGLARDGMRFVDAHSPASWCVPTRYGLLTGRYPCRLQHQQWRQRALIEPNQLTLATLLLDRGYATDMVGKCTLALKKEMTTTTRGRWRADPSIAGSNRFLVSAHRSTNHLISTFAIGWPSNLRAFRLKPVIPKVGVISKGLFGEKA